jgi:SAM-dependent methyltransferase
VESRKAFAHETGLADGSVDIAVCSQSFHWMEPRPTLREVARILRPGGVFAAVDCDMPAIDWEVETAAVQFAVKARRRRDELGIRVGVDQARLWPKDRHLQELHDSGWFEYVREMVVHNVETVSAERFVEESINVPGNFLPALRAAGVSDEEIGLDEFRRVASLRMGSAGRWFTGYRIRLGIRRER